MPDRVDTGQNAPTVRKLLIMLSLGGLMALMTLGMAMYMRNTFLSVGLFYFVGDHWQEVQGLPGRPKDMVRVSPAGMVWVQTHRGLGRFDGVEWQHYRGEDYGSDFYLQSGFVLLGEEVWGVTQDAIVHFDGQWWTAHPRALDSAESQAIVASESQIWVIDGYGNLSRFGRGERSVTSLRGVLPGVNWGSDSDPTLAWTSDNGALWLALDGLWRFDGAAWREVRPGASRLEKVRLVGQTGDRVWLWDGRHLLWVAADEADWGGYTMADLGLSDRTGVNQVIAQDGRLWVATSRGVLTFDGAAWERLPAPDKDYVTSVALAPDGSVWAIGSVGLTSEGVLFTLLPLVLYLCAMPVILLLLAVVLRRLA